MHAGANELTVFANPSNRQSLISHHSQCQSLPITNQCPNANRSTLHHSPRPIMPHNANPYQSRAFPHPPSARPLPPPPPQPPMQKRASISLLAHSSIHLQRLRRAAIVPASLLPVRTCIPPTYIIPTPAYSPTRLLYSTQGPDNYPTLLSPPLCIEWLAPS